MSKTAVGIFGAGSFGKEVMALLSESLPYLFPTLNPIDIFLCFIDDNIKSQIGLSFVEDTDIYVDDTPNQTARTYATLIIEPKIEKDKQKQLIIKFNKYLEEHRKKYNSLFLTNYRESKDIARKRISFDLVYSITEYILDNFNDI